MATEYRFSKRGDLCGPDGSRIPLDPENRHYAEYLEWRAQGNIPDGDGTPLATGPGPAPQQENAHE